MKIAIAQTKPQKGDLQKNLHRHLEFIDQAVASGVSLIVFPELSLTGYEPTLADTLAIEPGDSRLDRLQEVSDRHQMIIGVGVPIRTEAGICISMLLFQPHQPRRVYSKKYLHVDEEPYFVAGQNFPILELGEVRIGLAICYELSLVEHEKAAFENGANVYLASVAKTAEGVTTASGRLSGVARKYNALVLMSNCVGPSDDFLSAGGSAIWNRKGEQMTRLNDAEEGILIVDANTLGVEAKKTDL